MTDMKKLHLAACALSVFAPLKGDAAVSALIEMTGAPETERFAQCVSKYYLTLARCGCENDSVEYFVRLVLRADTVFARRIASGGAADGLKGAVERELKTLEELSRLTFDDFDRCHEYADIFAKWSAGPAKFPSADELISHIRSHGYGVFAQSVAYRYDAETKSLKPVENVRGIRLDDLKLYEDCKEAVKDNTLSFLQDLPANNVLLYGDRGTGKSSTVHAVLNEYKDRGLRLIEAGKSAIRDFPVIFSLIEDLKCLKFIIFIDDLTFVDGTDDFAELKAALEGSVHRPDNALIYATTNRRHLVRESHEARAADVHLGDTVQEQLSLSDRFGLVVTFVNPDKREFAEILSGILKDRKLSVEKDELSLLAERYALKKGGRSGRAAKQLADMIESRIRRNLPLDDLV